MRHESGPVMDVGFRPDEQYDSGDNGLTTKEAILRELIPGVEYTTSEVIAAVRRPKFSVCNALQAFRREGIVSSITSPNGFVDGRRTENRWATIPGPATEAFHGKNKVFDTARLGKALGGLSYKAHSVPRGAGRVHICADD